jgi:hypothetical protein
MGKLKNNFSNKTRQLFTDVYGCFLCGMNINHYGLELHHIWKRINNSPLNASIVCHKCHEDGKIHSKEYREKLFNKTLLYLHSQNYKMNDKDEAFLKLACNELNIKI